MDFPPPDYENEPASSGYEDNSLTSWASSHQQQPTGNVTIAFESMFEEAATGQINKEHPWWVPYL
jgi:hypothetical protein